MSKLFENSIDSINGQTKRQSFRITKFGAGLLGLLPAAAELLMDINGFRNFFHPWSVSLSEVQLSSFFGALLSAGILTSLGILFILNFGENEAQVQIANTKVFVIVNIIALSLIFIVKYFLFLNSVYLLF